MTSKEHKKHSDITRAAYGYYCRNEWAIHLDDVMVRRTSWHYYFRDAEKRSHEVANWMSELLGWDETKRADEILRYQKFTKA